MTYAEVAVDAPVGPGRTFSYSIPQGWDVRPGQAVQVPFGARQLPGFIFELAAVPGYPETRDIARVVGDEVWLTPAQLALARWISQAYRAPLYSAAALMVPSGFRQKLQAVYTPVQHPSPILLEGLEEQQRAVLEHILSEGQASQPELERRFRKRTAEIVLGQLVRKGLVKRMWVWRKPSVRPKLVRVARLTVSKDAAEAALETLAKTRATGEQAILEAVVAAGPAGIEANELAQRVSEAGAAQAALVKKGLVARQTQRRAVAAVPMEQGLALLEAMSGPRQQTTHAVMAAVLRAGPAGALMDDLTTVVPKAATALAALVRKGLVTRKTERRIVLHIAPEAASAAVDAMRREAAARERGIVQALLEAPGGALPLPELARRVPGSSAALEALAERDVVRVEQQRVERDPLAGRSYPVTKPLALTEQQERCWRPIAQALRSDTERSVWPTGALERAGTGPVLEPSVFLLFGITGSGKTELYLRALEQAVAQGKRGIVLVPEIALTPQTIARFASRFPGRVAVLHSRLSPGEQFDEWWRIRQGQFDVVIGPRSALFAPQPDLGVIVLDEEHEWTYKQDEALPYYHARDAAIKLAALTGATVILGSATPAIESFHKARSGEYRLLELPERIIETDGGVTLTSRLPAVEVVDMRQELKEGNRSIFSRSLRDGIEAALAQEEQVILFLNRRGSATFVQCRDCGYVARCRRCATALTYHGDEVALRCHQCNWQTPPPRRCPECWGARIRYLGLGTQRLEVETAQAFPRATIVRWDRDVTQGRDAHETILRHFLEHKADILIGTQMLAKGLHLPKVTLVGVINADIGLYVPDFRAAERVFQVLCQVAGRSGRGPAGGRVVLQTYSPGNYAIAAAATQDYLAFYEQEIARRGELGLPPFTRLARLLYRHTNATTARRESERVAHALNEALAGLGLPNTRVVGPAPAPVERLRGRYRWHLLIESPDPNPLLDRVTLPSGWTVDMDPVQMM